MPLLVRCGRKSARCAALAPADPFLEERIQLQFDGVPRGEQPAPRRTAVDLELIQGQSTLR
jgi:hypothetical protein